MMVTDMTHYEGVFSLEPQTHRPLFKLVDQLGAIVKAATVAHAGEVVATGIPCNRRPGRRLCLGFVLVEREEVPPAINWSCAECRDSGVIRNFRGTIWDLTPKGAPTDWRGEWREVHLSPNEYEAVRELKIADPDSERTVYAANRRGGLMVIACNEDELAHLAGLVADEAGAEADRRRRADLNAVFDRINDALGPPF